MGSFRDSYRDSVNDLFESHLGTSPKLRLLASTSIPTDESATQSGTLVCTMSLPSDWMGASSGGLKSKSGTWSGTSVATGTVSYCRFMNNADTTCYYQFTVSEAFSLVTSGSTAAGNNVLNFASVTGVTAGMGIYGTGIQTGTEVFGTGAGTVTMTLPSLSGVSTSTTVYFGSTDGEVWMYPATVGSIGVTLTVNRFDLLAGG